MKSGIRDLHGPDSDSPARWPQGPVRCGPRTRIEFRAWPVSARFMPKSGPAQQKQLPRDFLKLLNRPPLDWNGELSSTSSWAEHLFHLSLDCVDGYEDRRCSGVFRISKRGGKFSLATSAHTKGGQTKFSNFFSMSKKNFFWPKGGAWHNAPPNTPLRRCLSKARLFEARFSEAWVCRTDSVVDWFRICAHVYTKLMDLSSR